MSLTSQVGTAAGVLAAAGAAVSLWLGAERHAGPSRRAYRWFAVAAALWGAGVITSHVLAVPVEAAAIPPSVGDLLHPLADLILLGACLPLAAAAGRRGAIPYLAVLTITAGDALAVGARAVGLPPQVGALLVQAAGLALLAWAPWAGGG